MYTLQIEYKYLYAQSLKDIFGQFHHVKMIYTCSSYSLSYIFLYTPLSLRLTLLKVLCICKKKPRRCYFFIQHNHFQIHNVIYHATPRHWFQFGGQTVVARPQRFVPVNLTTYMLFLSDFELHLERISIPSSAVTPDGDRPIITLFFISNNRLCLSGINVLFIENRCLYVTVPAQITGQASLITTLTPLCYVLYPYSRSN